MTTATKTHIPSFKVTKEDTDLIQEIVKRADREGIVGTTYTQSDMIMDLKACHANGCPLHLLKLLNAPEDTFGHDVYGIRRFISRTTGKMPHTFLPRCAK